MIFNTVFYPKKHFYFLSFPFLTYFSRIAYFLSSPFPPGTARRAYAFLNEFLNEREKKKKKSNLERFTEALRFFFFSLSRV